VISLQDADNDSDICSQIEDTNSKKREERKDLTVFFLKDKHLSISTVGSALQPVNTKNASTTQRCGGLSNVRAGRQHVREMVSS